MKVLSLFDGISCGQLALQRAGIKVDNYYASEIKKEAISVTQKHFPNTIQLGDVTKIKLINNDQLVCENGVSLFQGIDLLIGGSPFQNFSMIGDGNGLEGEKSILFFEYLRLLKELKPKYFLLENVKMSKDNKLKIDEMLGVVGIEINSSLVSIQNRPRVYWTNIPNVIPPKDLNINFQDYIGIGDLEEAKVNYTPSRIKMWNNGEGINGLGTCDNITNKNKIRCITRKQDRSPNSKKYQ